jgi:hypothetical protein
MSFSCDFFAENNIGDEGAEELAEALMNNSSLEVLNLYGEWSLPRRPLPSASLIGQFSLPAPRKIFACDVAQLTISGTKVRRSLPGL